MNPHTFDSAQPLTRGLRPLEGRRISDGAYDLRFNTAAPNFTPGFAEAYAGRFRTRLTRWRTIARAYSTWGNAGFLQCRTFEEPLEVLGKDFGARRR